MLLDSSLLNIQHNKVRIKGEVEQSRERSSALPNTSGVVAIEKPSVVLDYSRQLYNIYIYIYMFIYTIL